MAEVKCPNPSIDVCPKDESCGHYVKGEGKCAMVVIAEKLCLAVETPMLVKKSTGKDFEEVNAMGRKGAKLKKLKK